MRAVAGGGRYDSLCEKLGGAKVPGVGFGMGDVVLADLLHDHDLLPDLKQSMDIFVASFTGDMKRIFQVATLFRTKRLSVSHSLSALKLGKQMEQANA
jgi:histidyl-tRNA synthetase